MIVCNLYLERRNHLKPMEPMRSSHSYLLDSPGVHSQGAARLMPAA